MAINRNKISETIFFLVFGTLLSWSIIAGIISCTELMPSSNYFVILRMAFISCAIYRIIFYNKYTLLITMALFVLTGILIAGDILISSTMPDTYVKAFIFITELIEYIQRYRYYTVEYETAIILALVVVIPLFFVITICLRFMFGTIATATCIVFALCFASGYFVYDQSFIVYLFCMIVLLVKKLNEQGSGESNSNIFAIACTPIAIICIIISANMPRPNNSVNIEWIEEAIAKPFYSISDSITMALSPKYFSLQTTGYLGTNSRLGGNANPDDKVVMEVTAKSYGYDVPRITGARKDVYTGYSWVNSTPGKEIFEFEQDNGASIELMELGVSYFGAPNIDKPDYYEILNFLDEISTDSDSNSMSVFWSFSIFNTFSADDYFVAELLGRSRSALININVLNNRTYSIFQPLNTYNINVFNAKPTRFYRNGIGDLTVRDLLSVNSSYDVHYKSIDPLMKTYHAKMSYKGLYADFLARFDAYNEKYPYDYEKLRIRYNIHNPDDEISLLKALKDVLIPYSEGIYERFTVLPEHFPDRVVTLAEFITEDYTSDFDKAKAIETFLRGYEYTLTPGDTPIDRDFVDYFLFDLQKGYCTSFATAFVTMCRAIGLPARYVEGYVMPEASTSDGVWLVTRRQGHAWGEVYFEGSGWNEFEPTPSSGLSIEPEEDSQIASVFSDYYDQYPQMDYMNYNRDMNHGDRTTQNNEQNIQEIDDGSSGLMNLINEMGLSLKMLIATTFLIVMLLLYMLFRYILCEIKKRRIFKQENNAIVITYFHEILKYVKFFHYDYYENETAIQYSKRVGKVFGFENDTKFMTDIAEIFTRAKYGNKPISDYERDIVVRAYETVNKRFKGNVNKYTYAFYKYIICII